MGNENSTLGEWKKVAQGITPEAPRAIPMDEVKQHASETDAWIALKGKVYNVTAFMKYHPGGKDMLVKVMGKDATSMFEKYHPKVNAEELVGVLCLGTLA